MDEKAFLLVLEGLHLYFVSSKSLQTCIVRWLNETWKYKKAKALECGITWVGCWTWEWRAFMIYKSINILMYLFIYKKTQNANYFFLNNHFDNFIMIFFFEIL